MPGGRSLPRAILFFRKADMSYGSTEIFLGDNSESKKLCEVIELLACFTGNLTDRIGPMKYELDSPQVFPFPADLTAPVNASTSENAGAK